MVKRPWMRKQMKMIKTRKTKALKESFKPRSSIGEIKLSEALVELGVEHSRQVIIKGSLADIVIGDVVVEVQGPSHNMEKVKERDREKRKQYEKAGYELITIREDQAFNHPRISAKAIRDYLKERKEVSGAG